MALTRFDSLPKTVAIAFAALGACAALAMLLAGANEAQGKKKKKGPGAAKVISTSQNQILSAGSIAVAGGRGTVAVQGISDGKVVARITVKYKATKGKKKKKKGKTKSAGAAAIRQARLTEQGRELLGGCSIDGLSARSTYRNAKGKKRSRAGFTVLSRDLAVCSVGSENPTATPYLGPPIPTDNADRCDFLDPAVCLQPWPNDRFTIADGSTDSGRRLDLDLASTPANTSGVHIDPTDYNRADGFSPGNMIILKIPQVQTPAAFQNSGLVPITNMRAYDDDNQAAVVINAETGERQPIWTELDSNPVLDGSGGPPAVNLIIRPARNFEEGQRYIVALRGLRDASNQPVSPPLPFRVYRDRLITSQAPVESRRAKMEEIISTLQSNGFQRSNLYMAWDFTVASETSLSKRALDIRNDALSRLGDTTPGDGVPQGSAPDFTVTSTTDNPDANTLRRVDGTLDDVPCYLNADGCNPGTQFDFDPSGNVQWNPSFTIDVPFRCIIPNSVDGGTSVDPAKGGTYGHGLLGAYTQVSGSYVTRQANEHNRVWCAVDWAGFSNADLGAVIPTLGNVSLFNRLADRMQQGFVHFHYLGRAMIRPDGFNSDPAFQVDAGSGLEPVIDTSDLYFEGISQGGIMGGALTATSPDIRRAVLNVPGINYSTLLRRSVDSDEYFKLASVGLYANYPNELERPLLLSIMQLLWDRGEGNGYAQHMTDDPLPATPSHDVLLQAALGDHQVANVAAEVEARTIGASVHKPALDPGRHWDVNPFMQIPAIGFGSSPFTPFTGSALVYYDGGPTSWFNNGATPQAALECSNGNPMADPCQGSAPPPNANIAPRDSAIYGDDPHGYPRRSVDGLQHIDDFLDPNGFILPCTDPGPVIRPCYANGWTGP